MIPEIRIADYNYPLPDDRIAKYPLPERDSSKLLVYKGTNTPIADHVFRELPTLLPEGCTMVFNDTRVVPARMLFQRDSGAIIEVFCLEPHDPVEYNVSFAATTQCAWKCVIGNAKKWKGDVLHAYNPSEDPAISSIGLTATLENREGQTGIVRFEWSGGENFSRVMDICGSVPIPPYLGRKTEDIDLERYQTLYAHIRGSVAAPTAGLHFTDSVLSSIRHNGVDIRNVCLHVGAGTFLPVKSDSVSDHTMHREPFLVSRSLLSDLASGRHPLVAVGTTSVRTLESLYYVGTRLIREGSLSDVDQWDPYTTPTDIPTSEALGAIVDYLDKHSLDSIKVGTRLIIVPGFQFRIVDALVTNFHQPESTLLLLVDAFVGGDWKSIYRHALSHSYRFLSYGDSSLLLKG